MRCFTHATSHSSNAGRARACFVCLLKRFEPAAGPASGRQRHVARSITSLKLLFGLLQQPHTACLQRTISSWSRPALRQLTASARWVASPPSPVRRPIGTYKSGKLTVALFTEQPLVEILLFCHPVMSASFAVPEDRMQLTYAGVKVATRRLLSLTGRRRCVCH